MTLISTSEISRVDFPRTWEVLDWGISEGVAPGFSVGFWCRKDPDRFYTAAIGNRRVIPSVLPMQVNTVFDLASVSKVFATAALAALLVERRWLSWNTPVSSVFSTYSYPEVQVRHLLSHTAGYVATEPFWERLKDAVAPLRLEKVSVSDRQEIMRRNVFSSVPVARPGETTVYSDITFLLLGFLLEEITSMPLDRAVQKWIWEPMGIHSAYYQRVTDSPDRQLNEKVAATENCPWRGGVLQGQVHDDNCWAMGGYGGHAGAFGTVTDVLTFARALMTGFYSQATLEAMWGKVSEPGGCERTLGWDTPSPQGSSVGKLFSPLSVGHLGFTGTSLWIDRPVKLAVTLLSNRVHPSRENIRIRELRPRFHEALRLDLRDQLGIPVFL